MIKSDGAFGNVGGNNFDNTKLLLLQSQVWHTGGPFNLGTAIAFAEAYGDATGFTNDLDSNGLNLVGPTFAVAGGYQCGGDGKCYVVAAYECGPDTPIEYGPTAPCSVSACVGITFQQYGKWQAEHFTFAIAGPGYAGAPPGRRLVVYVGVDWVGG